MRACEARTEWLRGLLCRGGAQSCLCEHTAPKEANSYRRKRAILVHHTAARVYGSRSVCVGMYVRYRSVCVGTSVSCGRRMDKVQI